MDRWKNQVAIVTGASSGIGAAIVENLVNCDLKVVGLSRRKEILDELTAKFKGKQFYGIKADITKEEDILNAFKWVKENLGPISILINNAGVIKYSLVMNTPTSDFKNILDTNVLGLAIATREAIQNMRDNGVNGHIVHINSVAGHYVPQFQAGMNIYPATKHAVTALTETLRQELNIIQSKIKVTSISPGLVDTNIFEASGLLKQLDAQGKQTLEKSFKLDSKDVADAVTYALGTPPHVQIAELTIRPVGEPF